MFEIGKKYKDSIGAERECILIENGRAWLRREGAPTAHAWECATGKSEAFGSRRDIPLPRIEVGYIYRSKGGENFRCVFVKRNAAWCLLDQTTGVPAYIWDRTTGAPVNLRSDPGYTIDIASGRRDDDMAANAKNEDEDGGEDEGEDWVNKNA